MPIADICTIFQAVQAQTTSSSLLFTSANVTAGDTSVDYTSCSLEKSFVVTGSSLDQTELQETTGVLCAVIYPHWTLAQRPTSFAFSSPLGNSGCLAMQLVHAGLASHQP